jgi:hypothetical protein
MRQIIVETNKIIKCLWLFNGLIFFKIREEWREEDLKREIYKNVKSGDYKYKA